MRAKEFMEQVQRVEKELKVLRLRREHYIELATMTSPSGSGMPGKKGDVSSRTETAAVALVDLAAELDKRITEYSVIVKQAEELIEKIPQEKFRAFLTLHYLCGMSMRSCSDELGYKDSKSIYRVRGFALAALQAKMLDIPPI